MLDDPSFASGFSLEFKSLNSIYDPQNTFIPFRKRDHYYPKGTNEISMPNLEFCMFIFMYEMLTTITDITKIHNSIMNIKNPKWILTYDFRLHAPRAVHKPVLGIHVMVYIPYTPSYYLMLIRPFWNFLISHILKRDKPTHEQMLFIQYEFCEAFNLDAPHQ